MTYETLIDNFQLHTNQIFTALDACRVCLLNDKKNSKGVIYQVDTGEGKFCIIILIAAVLVISKKKQFILLLLISFYQTEITLIIFTFSDN